MSEEDSDEDDSVGPSDPAKAKKARQAAKMADAMDEDDDEEESGDDDEVDLKSAISKLIKGKGKATDDDDDSVSDEGLDLEETVICTLNPDNVSLLF